MIACEHEAPLTGKLARARALLQAFRPQFLASALVFGFLWSNPAFAQDAGAAPDAMIKNILTFILGPFGKSLAMLGIVAIGVSWMFGRASLGLVAGVIGGIIIMFGASFLANSLIG
ncbi:pilin major subunit VirB2 [Rhizobium leguminosarum]|uniref:pilin major subunit VirB2 n=1 Tax=Rhizobium TaxID=379 RepID=UPI001031F16F|nr:pilin major subunit VirB2 [Rhizobium leguminosarum]TBF87504.1 pilin major subunit VirB2 [Rhizobium leguminosarum]TBG06980.1 pilin major subunit VirB2 [Rhizobium leguminosarum]TBG07851.1 pilin major subunit VirB2 [Rhizobium leguminosarum]TBG30017.1 pilin major subunit VirB2 [Rhizobium leguminosarum]TBG50150.1 pilin major subunit VirB2 [Rhizobium leguminosarum]